MKKSANFNDFVDLMAALRDPQSGCPWDLKQDFESLRGYLLEECHEALDALDRKDLDELKQELGDLLLQIVFLSRVAEERGAFTVSDVIESISDKMIRRHPHIFGRASAEDPEAVLQQWEEIKAQERLDQGKPASQGLLAGVPQSLPALLQALRVGERAARVGFDWESPEDVLEKIEEEYSELKQALQHSTKAEQTEELGDVLFTLSMLARKLEIDPERACLQTIRKFRARFAWMEQEATRNDQRLQDMEQDALEQMWVQAKERLKS